MSKAKWQPEELAKKPIKSPQCKSLAGSCLGVCIQVRPDWKYSRKTYWCFGGIFWHLKCIQDFKGKLGRGESWKSPRCFQELSAKLEHQPRAWSSLLSLFNCFCAFFWSPFKFGVFKQTAEDSLQNSWARASFGLSDQAAKERALGEPGCSFPQRSSCFASSLGHSGLKWPKELQLNCLSVVFLHPCCCLFSLYLSVQVYWTKKNNNPRIPKQSLIRIFYQYWNLGFFGGRGNPDFFSGPIDPN